ncbi:MAG: Lrp/AsnC family transcriptional regulator, partial [Gaiellaceae bacterium]
AGRIRFRCGQLCLHARQLGDELERLRVDEVADAQHARHQRAHDVALQANGRESFRAIAARLGVSEATIRARYARLCAEDILQVVGVTNPLGLGFEQALVGVKTAGSPEPVADEIASWIEADYVVVTAGQYDLVVEVVATDRRELLEVTNRMRALDGVVSTETFLYLQMVKQLYDWGTRVREDS